LAQSQHLNILNMALGGGWWLGVAVTCFIWSTKLLYAGLG